MTDTTHEPQPGMVDQTFYDLAIKERNFARGELDALVEAAQHVVMACAGLLPLRGSWPNYRIAPSIEITVSALPEEWADAAHAIADLARVASRG